MKVTSVEYEMCLCYAVHTEWRSSVMIIRHEGFLSNLKTCCFPSRLPNLGLLVWPNLNENSHLMHFKDCSESKFRIFKNSNCRLLLFLHFFCSLFSYEVLTWSYLFIVHPDLVKLALTVSSFSVGLCPGHDRAVLWRTGRPHLPRSLLFCHRSHVQLDRLQRASHLAGQEVKHPLATYTCTLQLMTSCLSFWA